MTCDEQQCMSFSFREGGHGREGDPSMLHRFLTGTAFSVYQGHYRYVSAIIIIIVIVHFYETRKHSIKLKYYYSASQLSVYCVWTGTTHAP